MTDTADLEKKLREAADSAQRDYYGANEDLMREAAAAMAKWRRERDEARAEADRVRRALECCEAALSEFEEPVTTRVEITAWGRVLLVALKRVRAALLPTQQGGQKDAADVRDCGGEP